ncbi:methyltransferase regulatory domain-containing protein [Polyangium aurulentum]|uniref:methyltransferase regulatory domain-containing protein n=1 Tax=Polyangium aurulentum TaxID=2567896 RepID=UPI0010AE0FB2|nr:class I SAM-dependent methyltransferase [Polyangium aurulentum]UQA62824.1 class I SAM-dependent methyltransferase [Polyangium aurulentum]
MVALAVAEYDDYLYDDFPCAEAHPDRLGAIGALFGLVPASPTSCRLLEIGAGLGGNLLPLAAVLPDSTFVGIDLAERPVAIAAEAASEAGLDNVRMLAADVREFDEAPGSFDYIVCHGVYSWVPDDVREAILRAIGRLLAPHGIAYVSFNALPGWHLRGAIRDMLRREVGAHGSPEERVARARAFLRFLSTAPKAGGTQAFLHDELRVLEQLSDRYLYYEHLAAHNHPQYFADFVEDAGRFGLSYLAEATVPSMFPERLGPDAARAVAERGRDQIGVEHSLDLLEMRLFRRALVCRAEALTERNLSAARVTGLVVSSWMTPTSVMLDLGEGVAERFRRPNGPELSTDKPLLKAALLALAGLAPGGLPFETLLAEARATLGGGAPSEDDRAWLARSLLGLYTQGAIELGAFKRPIASAPSVLPMASRWARLQARHERAACTNLLHQSVAVDAFDRALLARMNGTRGVRALAEGALQDAARGALSVSLDGAPCTDKEVFVEIAEQKLGRLAKSAFLVG